MQDFISSTGGVRGLNQTAYTQRVTVEVEDGEGVTQQDYGKTHTDKPLIFTGGPPGTGLTAHGTKFYRVGIHNENLSDGTYTVDVLIIG